MGNNRERYDPLSSPTNPSSTSSPVSVSDPNSLIGSASGSFKNQGFLSDLNANISDAEFGFSCPEFRHTQLAGTVDFYERHVFLCYKNPQVWPPRIESAEFDRLPRLLSAAVMTRKGDMKKNTHLTICEGCDGTETSNGDGSYVFVCCHGSRDRRCGECGPTLVSRFRDEIRFLGLENEVSVSPCSHIGGHKYAGNVIIFGSNTNGEVTGHWYGYVSPEDVFLLLQQHISNGKIVDELWRGQMGLSKEEQKLSQQRRLRLISKTNGHKSKEESARIETNDPNFDLYSSRVEVAGCCRGDKEGYSSCCQNPELSGTVIDSDTNDIPIFVVTAKSNGKPTSGSISGDVSFCEVGSMPTWFESWEREDTYAVAAVICATMCVAIAYSFYKQL
ncbi:AIM32, partial [Cucurbita argyrosperma subsp. argyrosperma]